MQTKHTAGPLMADPAIKMQDENGRHFLSGVVYRNSDCGCRVAGGGTLPQPLRVEHCAQHAAVAGLLDALQTIALGNTDPDRMVEIAAAAIKATA